MPGPELSRPAVRDVVGVDIAEAELAAVRDLLDQLRADVFTEERAAVAAEQRPVAAPRPAAHPAPEVGAIALSRQIVEQMAAARRGDRRTSEDDAIRLAEAQLAEATRRAADLAAAARREAAELLRTRLDGAPPAPPHLHWAEPLPELRHWAAPAPAAPPPAVPAPTVRPADETTQAHEQFWREEAQATAARTAGVAPVEVLLPTAALLLVLVAVLLLIH
jgi:hypothetical protein